MGGGLMQLVAYGAQDIYLTGNPQITFFKVVYRRHTNFSMESIEQTFNGSVGYGNRVTATISRNGDLVKRIWLQGNITALNGATTERGHKLVSEVELEIGGQRVDKQYADWMEMWSQLTLSEGHRAGYELMTLNASGTTGAFYVPLQFWFCRNPGLALPLIALQYHEVKVNLTFGAKAHANDTLSCSLWVDYIYLDTDERRRFAQVSHEYLIEQVQFTGAESITNSPSNVRLNFNHPVKELVWAEVTSTCSYAALTGDCKLQLNGHDRFAARPVAYFKQVQPYQHHTRVPAAAKNVHVYSFALKPEEHQPSGTCNFSRIDNATLTVTASGANKSLHVYAVNYNVLRVMSGMGGLAYSN